MPTINEDGTLVQDERFTNSVILLEANGETPYDMDQYGINANTNPSDVIEAMSSAIEEDKGIDISTGYTVRLSGENFYILAKPQQG